MNFYKGNAYYRLKKIKMYFIVYKNQATLLRNFDYLGECKYGSRHGRS